MPAPPVFRFAPSPNGALHLGHAYSALVAHDMARVAGGRFLVRIEDIDLARCRPEYEARMLNDLAWLGLAWEEPVRRQSEHLGDYGAALAKLEGLGVLYPCFATRREIADIVARNGGVAYPRDPDGAPLYPGLYRGRPPREVAERKAAGEPYALRLDMGRAMQQVRAKSGERVTFTECANDGEAVEIAIDPARWGDAVIARKDVPTSYHLAVVVDDALQGVSHVTRGRDLYTSTDLHRLLQILLDLPAPLYHHHALITDATGRKLAKSRKDTSLAALREQGATPADIRRRVGLPA